MTIIGEVSKVPVKAKVICDANICDIEWKISNFPSFLNESDKCYESPLFPFFAETWCLKIFPNGNKNKKSTGCISLYLIKKSCGAPISLDYTLGLKRFDGNKDSEHYRTHIFTDDHYGYGLHACLAVSELIERKSDLMRDDVLTVFCNLMYQKSVASLIQQGIKENCKEVSTQAQEKKIDASLDQDFQKMLLNGRHHDIILKVGDRELRAHRDVLRARSRVFESMFDLDMKEKDSDSIDIQDCDAEAMEQFLFYIYSGTVDRLDQSNMLNLYYIADKYDVKCLKDACRDFIQKSLSLTNICKVIQLAMNHTDLCLLENATEYFSGNMLAIMSTMDWQSFLKDNTIVGNELLMKSIKKLKNT